MKSFIFLYLMCIANLSFGQSAYIDSLKKALNTARHDTVKCNILSLLAENAPDEEWPAFNLKLKLLAEAKLKQNPTNVLKRTYTRYLANAITNEGSIAQGEGNNKMALGCYRKSAELHSQINYKAGQATSINNIGSIYERIGYIDSAVYYYVLSLNLSRESKDLAGEANSLSNIGSVYSSKGNISEALSFFEQSLKICERIGDDFGASLNLGKIGVIYHNQNEDTKAIENFKKCYEIREKIGFEQGVAEVANALGALYFGQKKIALALTYYEKSMILNQKFNNKHGISLSLLNIGSVYEYRSDHNKAIDYYDRALKIMEEMDNKDLISNALTNMSEIYLKQNKIDEAFICCKRAFDIAQELGFPKEISDASELLARIYKLKGKYKEAFDMQELHFKMHDSINNEATKKSTIRAQFKYEYEKKSIADSLKATAEKKLYEAKLTQEKTNKYLLILGLVLALLISFTVFQKIRHSQRQNVLQLRNKIASDLHDDIGSSLSSIKMFAGMAKLDPKKAIDAKVIDKIEATSGETIENMSDIVWSINPKNDNFVFVLEKMKHFGEGICNSSNIRFTFFSEIGLDKLILDIEQRKNLFLIYKEALNNAVKYSNASEIEVCLKRKQKLVMLSISDNGSGINPDNINKGNGIGNMKQRAKDINGDLTINSSSGTLVSLEFKTT